MESINSVFLKYPCPIPCSNAYPNKGIEYELPRILKIYGGKKTNIIKSRTLIASNMSSVSLEKTCNTSYTLEAGLIDQFP